MSVSVTEKIVRLLDQHRTLHRGFAHLEGQFNDLESASQLKALRKKIDADRLALGPWPIQLQQDVSKIERQLRDHFGREEEVLDECCRMLEDEGLMATFRRLHSDHSELIARMDDLGREAKQITLELSGGQDWIERAFVLRVHITNTRVLLEKHAAEEEILFRALTDRFSVYGREST